MARALLLVLLWVIQVAAVAVFTSSTWLQEQIAQEKMGVQAYLGEETAHHLSAKADDGFRRMFVDTEVVSHVYRFLIPDDSVPKHGTEGLAPWFFEWLDDSLRTFWFVAYQAIYRLLLFSEWMPYLGILILAAVIDGLVERKIRKKNRGYANPVRYRAGIRLLIILFVVPLLYLTLPISVTPLLVPAWIFAAGAVLMLVTANAQHRI